VKRIKGREIALLLVPVLLAGGAFVLQRNQRPTDGPFRLVFDRATVERITSPRLLAEGYDTKVTVYADYAGQTPDWWTPDILGGRTAHYGSLIYIKEGKALHYRSPNGEHGIMMGGGFFNKERQRYVYEYSMRLAQVPVSDGPTFYKTTLEGSFTARSPDGYMDNSRVLKYTPIPISVLVRQPGEIVKVPPVSRYCPLRLQSVSVTPPPTRYDKESTQVIVYFKNLGSPPENNDYGVRLGSVKLLDEKGREQRFRDSRGASYYSISGLPTNKAGQRNAVLNIPLTGIPKSAGRLTLKTSASIDDCWPLPVSVVVRK
jgi:hypothetical protein